MHIDETIHGRILSRADQQPAAPAIDFFGRITSYGELRVESMRLAIDLVSAGIGKGDVVGMLLPNIPHFPIATYAINRVGATALNLNPLYPEHAARFLKLTNARALITYPNARVFTRKLASLLEGSALRLCMFADVAAALPGFLAPLGAVKQLMDPEWRHYRKRERIYSASSAEIRRWELGRMGCTEEDDLLFDELYYQFLRPIEVPSSATALLQYTSGSTGSPKLAVHTHRGVLANVEQLIGWKPDLREGKDRFFMAIPFHHIYGNMMMHLALATGSSLACVPNPFDTADVVKQLKRSRPTIFPLIPRLLAKLLESGKLHTGDLTTLETVICGGDFLQPDLKKRFEDVSGSRIYRGYGSSEALIVSVERYGDPNVSEGSIGFTLPGIEARILNQEEAATAGSIPGELLVCGPQVMKGYHGDEAESPFCGEWLRTGDIGRQHADGSYSIVDRLKRSGRRGSEYFFPAEIDEVLLTHPAVKEGVAIALPDPAYGQQAAVVVVLNDGWKPNEETRGNIRGYLQLHLARPQWPRDIFFRGEPLPRNLLGKVEFFKVEAEYLNTP